MSLFNGSQGGSQAGSQGGSQGGSQYGRSLRSAGPSRVGPRLGPASAHPRLSPTPNPEIVSGRGSPNTRSRASRSPEAQAPPALVTKATSAYGGAGKDALADGSDIAGENDDFTNLLGVARAQSPVAEAQPQAMDEQSLATAPSARRSLSPTKKGTGRARKDRSDSESQASLPSSTTRSRAKGKGKAKASVPAVDLSIIDENSESEVEEPPAAALQGNRRSGSLKEIPSSRPATRDSNTTTYIANPLNYASPSGFSQDAAPRGRRARATPARVIPAPATTSWRQLSIPHIPRSWRTLNSWLALVAVLSLLIALILQLTTLVPAVSDPPDINTLTPSWHDPREGGRFKLGRVIREGWKFKATKYFASHELNERVERIEQVLSALQDQGKLHSAAIKNLEKVLPDALIVHYKKGEYQIPEHFWRAIKEKLDSNYDFSPKWDDFLRANNVAISEYVFKVTNDEVARRFTESRIVTQEEFTRLVAQNYENLSAESKKRYMDLEYKYNTVVSTIRDSALSSTRQEIQKALDQLPKAQISSLAAANMEKNAALALSRVNFFSPPLGAVVDPYLSSPTMTPTRTWTEKLYFNLRRHYPNPPITALEPWSEPGECWCAAPPEPKTASQSQNGMLEDPRAQLAVLLPRLIHPTAITVEHIPRSGTLDRDVAPREMELWAEIERGSDWAQVAAKAEQIYGHREESGVAVHADERNAAEIAVPEGYVMIGRWTYDWEATERVGGNHIQTFSTDVDMEALGIGTRKVLVRAKSNFGGAYTCLYRVRLHGNVAYDQR